jgi:hypothetical protein
MNQRLIGSLTGGDTFLSSVPLTPQFTSASDTRSRSRTTAIRLGAVSSKDGSVSNPDRAKTTMLSSTISLSFPCLPQ